MRALLRSGTGAVLALSIMFIGSFVLWLGTPLLWIWVGSQIQGATQSVASALAAMFVGVLLSIMLLALVLVKLSTFYRANHRARGLADPGNRVLEAVLVVSAAVTLIAFAIWFLFIAGASPVPGMGVQL
jgi:heme/copper-type cytochrome/quinol oxidase subunit 2